MEFGTDYKSAPAEVSGLMFDTDYKSTPAYFVTPSAWECNAASADL